MYSRSIPEISQINRQFVPREQTTRPRLSAAQLDETGQRLRLHWQDGTQARFHALWLRDNCCDDASRHPGNGQRLFTLLDWPDTVRLIHAEITDHTLRVEFRPEYRSEFSAAWLYTHRYDYDFHRPRQSGWLDPLLATWGSELGTDPPRAGYPELRQSPQALAEWLQWIRRYGFAMLSGCGTESGALFKVVELFGHVRETNYGRCFEVRSEIDPVNLAYTGMALQVHTDNPYRDPVPGLQLLHCLVNDAAGGDSIVVDGFRAAELLRCEDPQAFDLLSRCPVPFEYRSRDTRLRAEAPLIGLSAAGELLEVRFNNRSMAAPQLPYERMEGFYAAYRRFAQVLARSELQVGFKLQPGELFVVDNRRVLHGRKAYAGAGGRHLQGCYADHDALRSRLAMLGGWAYAAAL